MYLVYIECFDNWIEEEYCGDPQIWEEATGWNYEEEIEAIKTGDYDYDFLEMREIETED